MIGALWLAWLLYWRLSAVGVKPAERREPLGSRLLHVVPLLLAALLLAVRRRGSHGMLFQRFLAWSPAVYWIGVALVLAGLAFSVWARVHLGRNWSAAVTVKQDHELVRSGPYTHVRHPIYTGILLALIGSALALGQWRGVLAVLIAFAALWRKLRLEERWMQQTFGAAYTQYQAHSAALIPYIL